MNNDQYPIPQEPEELEPLLPVEEESLLLEPLDTSSATPEAPEAMFGEEAPAEEPEVLPVEEVPCEEQESLPVEEAPTDEPEILPVEEAHAEEPEILPVEEAPTEEPEQAAAEAASGAEAPAQPASKAEEGLWDQVSQPDPTPENAPDPLYHELLADPTVGDEILADEHAVSAAGLMRPGDAEVEQILQEAQNMEDTRTLETVPLPPQAYDIPIQEYEEPMKEKKQPRKEPRTEVPKGRPRMKKGYGLLGIPHILSTVVWLAITVLIGVSLGRMVWICAAEVLAFGNPDQTITITISDGDNIETISSKLKAAGLIKYPQLFKMYADLTDAEAEISAGTFTLNTKFDYHALVNAMSYHSPAREVVELVIPEGYTCAQIFALLEEEGVCSAAELEEYAANGEIKERWFLEDIVRGDKYCLEGYLFPDTYEFYTNDEPGRVLGKFLDNFDARFTDLMKERIETLNQRMADVLAGRGYTQEQIESRLFGIREIVIIASMIERETANDAESYDISSVIYNRLTNPANYPYLNIDATLIYALGGNIDPETGKTKPLTNEDLQMEHPYNTYTVKGLIPGPISNPGRNSLNAALDPTETSFYYYVYNPNTSQHLFAKNDKEHQKNVDYVKSLESD